MTNEEIFSKIREMRNMANELERDYTEKLTKFDKKESYTWEEMRDIKRLSIGRESLKQISTLLAFNV